MKQPTFEDYDMTIRTLCLLILPLFALCATAQTTALPSASPSMTYTDEDGNVQTDTQYDGDAPFHATFEANVTNLGDYEALCEWRFTKSGTEAPFLVRYDEDTEYTFSESGSFTVELLVSFVQGTDTIAYEMDEPFSITIAESKLEVPNAFTPNGDGVNDVFRVKEGYKSIISFKAQVFNRWGKKMYEWTDIEGGWDGRSGGGNAPDGGYYLHIEAKGADGRKYNIKKVINLLRGYTENGTAGN